MTRLQIGLWTIRVWRNESLDGESIDGDEVRSWIRQSVKLNLSLRGTMDEIEKLPRVVAVEILDMDGDGELVYPEWP